MMNRIENEAASPRPEWQRILAIAVLGLVGALALGVIVGVMTRYFEVGSISARGGVVLALAIVAVASVAIGVVRLYQTRSTEPVAPRVRRSQRALWLSMGVGALLGLFLAVSLGPGNSLSLYSNDPMPAWIAAVAIAVWVGVVPWISFMWWRQVDEHEREAYAFGMIAALYLYIFVTPAWWLGWRGGFLPEPAPMLTFAAVMTVWGLGWLWHRYR